MDTRRLRDWFCLVLTFPALLLACSPPPDPADTVPPPPPAPAITGVIPPAGSILKDSLTFVLDREITPLAADAAGTASLPLIATPRLDGDFRVGANFIHFTPGKIPPDAIFEIRINPAILGLTSATAGQAPGPLHFTSFEFMPTRLGIIDQTSSETMLALEFNAAVAVGDLAGRIDLADANLHSIQFQLRPGTNGRTARLVLPPRVALPVSATVKAGTPEARHRIVTSRNHALRSPVPSPLRVYSNQDLRLRADGQSVTLQTNYPVDPAALHAALRVEDLGAQSRDLPTTITARPDQLSFVIDFKAPDPRDVRVNLRVAGLRSTSGIPMESEWSQSLGAQITLQFNNAYWNTEASPPRLQVHFNHPVDADLFRAKIRIEPPVADLTVNTEGSHGFALCARWKANTEYRLTLEPGAMLLGWAVVNTPVVYRVNGYKGLPPRLTFPMQDKYYSPRRYGNAIPLETRGLDAVDLKLYRVFPNNLPLAIEEISAGSRGEYYYGRHDSSRMQEVWSELIAEKTFAVNRDDASSTYTLVALDRLTSAPLRGIYCVSAGAKIGGEDYEYYREQMRIVLLTNLGLLAHWQDDQLVLFAHHLFTLAPAAGARVRVYSEKNQLLGETTTDAQGIARLRNFKKSHGMPRVAVVEGDGDSTFLKLDPESNDHLPIDYADPEFNAAAYDAYIHADRELYRPGETVHLRCIVRHNYGDALTSAPLILDILKPDGRTLATETIRLGAWGTAGFDYATQKTHPTGRYAVQLKIPGGNTVIGKYEFQLEEFVPNRMKVKLAALNPAWVNGEEPFQLRLTASHLFGGAATSRTADAHVDFARGHAFTAWPDYQFDNDRPSEPISTVPLGEKITDRNGEAVFRFDGANLDSLTYPVHVRASGRVHELGGRAVAASASAVYFPSPTLVGIGARPGEAKGSVEIRVVAIRPDQCVADLAQVSVTLEKMEWDYYVRRYYSHYSARWSDRYNIVETRSVALAQGLGSTVFNAPDYGYYRVTARAAGSAQFSTVFFCSSGGRPRISRQPEQQLIKLLLDKSAVNAGESVRLRIESPFDGKAIVVVQHGGIKRIFPVTIKNERGEIDIATARDWSPNVWIEATVIHAVEEGRKQVYPFASFAMIPLKVNDRARAINVALPSLPTETTPNRNFTIEIETRDHQNLPVAAEVTLAAVDEGIYSITGYVSPNPASWLARRRRPDVRRANYYDLIAEKWQPPTPGGDGEEVSRRLGRTGQNWIKTVALWTGVVRTGRDGKANVALQIPEFNGQLRIVAVAANAAATGSTEKQLYVRRPWMLQTSMPRFLLPGDNATCRATLFNTTASTCTALLSWSTSGTLLSAEATSDTTLIVPPGGEMSAGIAIRAKAVAGQGMLRWHARIRSQEGSLLQELVENAPINVMQPAAYESRATMRVIRPGERIEFSAAEFLQDDWSGIELTLGGNPLLRLQKHLRFVVQYPYGCVEQTTSKLMPLYLLRKHSALISSAVDSPEKLDDYLRFGIDRLFSMQTIGGGLGFWPGAQQPYDYGSIYAFHFLTLARNGREIPIDEQKYEALRNYVRGLTADAFDGDSSSLYRRAYAIYVLTLSGDTDAIAQIERFDQMEIPRPARYLLAGALAIATRDTDRVKLYLNASPSIDHDVYEYAGTLNSPARNLAVELISLIEMDAPAAEIAARADLLMRAMESRPHFTTHENAFMITALCKYLETLDTRIDLVSATIEWPGGSQAIAGTGQFHRKIRGTGQRFIVINSGQSELYATYVTSGIPRDPVGRIEQGVSINRRLMNRDGSPADPAHLRQGETYVAEISIRCERDARHFVIADLLPAGLEIENPRLNPNAQTGLTIPFTPTQPTHLELRDDRLVLVFDHLAATPEPHRFYYVLNAVTPGRFVHPAVAGECMYDPATRGANDAGSIEIE